MDFRLLDPKCFLRFLHLLHYLLNIRALIDMQHFLGQKHYNSQFPDSQKIPRLEEYQQMKFCKRMDNLTTLETPFDIEYIRNNLYYSLI